MIVEMRDNAVCELPMLSLKRRIDRSALYQDWRHQRFPVPYGLDHLSDKITTPHFKKTYRLIGRTTGKAEADLICVHDETVDDTEGDDE